MEFVEVETEEAYKNAVESENPIIVGGKVVDVLPTSLCGKRPMRGARGRNRYVKCTFSICYGAESAGEGRLL